MHRRWARLQEQACPPKWQNIMPDWILQNTHRNCSTGLGKVEEGSGSARQSRQCSHMETVKSGRLPIPEAGLAHQDQAETDVVPITSVFAGKEMWCPLSARCGGQDTSMSSYIAPRCPTPAKAVLRSGVGGLVGWCAVKKWRNWTHGKCRSCFCLTGFEMFLFFTSLFLYPS